SNAGAAKTLGGAVFVRISGAAVAARPTQRPAHALWRRGQHGLKPRAKCLVEQALGLTLGQHAEERIDRRFNRPLAKQVRAEAVNRADVRFLEILNRVVESLLNL